MQRLQAGSLAWEEWAAAQEPGPWSHVPPWGPPLKVEEKSLTARTERTRETQVDSALPTDTLIKESSLGNA